MKLCPLLIRILLLMRVLARGMGFFFSSLLSTNASTTPPLLTSAVTPTNIPMPTDTPTPIPPPPLVNGSSAYLRDATSGRVLLDMNSHLQVPMWSATKIMTALLAIERLPPDQVVTLQQAELDEVASDMSIAQLHATDQMSIRHLLSGLLFPSGSDAEVVLAHTVSGKTASVVLLMNVRAVQLALTETEAAPLL